MDKSPTPPEPYVEAVMRRLMTFAVCCALSAGIWLGLYQVAAWLLCAYR